MSRAVRCTHVPQAAAGALYLHRVGTMSADPLREKLKALVEEWREDTEYVLKDPAEYAPRDVFECRSIKRCADQLAALLAESEPEPSFRDVTATRCLRHATIPPTIMPPGDQECGVCMREEGMLSGRAEQRSERAWLIESRFTPAPTWWTGTDHPAPWTRDSLKAVRFCRKCDAEAAMASLQDGHFCFVSEHQWGLSGPDCEAKAKLPLGHTFDDGGHEDCDYCWAHVSMFGHGDCGQPRSEHEPK